VNVRVLFFASVLAGTLAVSGAPAATPRHVPLTISIAGQGTVRLSDGRRLACSGRCHKTFSVLAGAKLNLTARPSSGWAFAVWGGMCRGGRAICGLRPRRGIGVAATFAPPGSTSANPTPLGQSVAFKDGWTIKVGSATLDATAQIVAIPGNSPPHPGAQYTMLNLSATYTGGGSSTLANFGEFDTIGVHNFSYPLCYEELPPPVLQIFTTVYSGQSINGNICFEVASNDAASLQLRTYGGGSYSKTWFALR